MSIKENLIKESLERCQNRIKFLRSEIFDNDPISKQLEVHKKFEEFLREKKGKERTTKKSIEYINELSKEMDLHKKRAESYNFEKLMKELTELEIEHKELVNEDWQLRQRNKY